MLSFEPLANRRQSSDIQVIAKLSAVLLFCATSLVFESAAFAQNVKIEKVQIETQSLNAFEFLTHKKTDKRAKITGELRLPAGKDKLPVVLLVHGSGGVGKNINFWVPVLNQLGIATLVIDSFTGRGVVNTIADQAQVSNYAMVYDSYRALELLSKHPRVDPDRIAIMGFSKGAVAALYSSMTRFQEFYALNGAKFAAHLAFYPPCNTTHIDDTKVGKASIRIFHGAADDYVLIGPCRDYIGRLKTAGADAGIFEYVGAHHSFDNSTITRVIKLPTALTSRKCVITERPAGIFSTADGQRYGAKSPCIERGTTVAHSAAALAAARGHVTALLKEVFKTK
jgi:dienelactone hydrolase